MTDAEKKEFLTNCLPELEEIEKIATEARRVADNQEIALQQIQNRIVSLEAELVRHRQNDPSTTLKPIDIATIAANIKTVDDEVMDLAGQAGEAHEDLVAMTVRTNAERARCSTELHQSVQNELGTLTAKQQQQQTNAKVLEEKIRSLRDLLKQFDVEHRAVTQSLQAEVQGLRTKHREMVGAYATKSDIENRLSRLELEIRTLKSNVCPTCQREWSENQTKLQELQTEMAALQNKLVILDAIKGKISELDLKIAALDTQIATPPDDPKIAETHQGIELTTAHFTEIVADIKAIDQQKLQIQRTIESQIQVKNAELNFKLKEKSSTYELLDAAMKSKIREHDTLKARLVEAERRNREIESQINQHATTTRSVQELLITETSRVEPLRKSIALESSVAQALGRTGYLEI
jgi:DNA repair exonuclease SbcCD ATPase subunit